MKDFDLAGFAAHLDRVAAGLAALERQLPDRAVKAIEAGPAEADGMPGSIDDSRREQGAYAGDDPANLTGPAGLHADPIYSRIASRANQLIRNLNPIPTVRVTELVGYATWYPPTGHLTKSGEPYDPNAMTAAMTPDRAALGTRVSVLLYSNPGRSISVRVNDRGPWATGRNGHLLLPRHASSERVIDLTPRAFESLTGDKRLGKVLVIVMVPDPRAAR